jgi:hypothetical protein
MLSERNIDTASELLTAAIENLDRGVDVETLPAELERLAETLRTAARAQQASARRVVPAARGTDDDASSRYRRAAVGWPVSPAPPHERFAAALASFHEAADAARLAARRCDRAKQAVEALFPPLLRS